MNAPEKIKGLISEASLTYIHWKVWFLAAMGIFLEGYDLFIISVALPLINQDFLPSPLLQGFIAASATLGMIFGAIIGGFITDCYGRRSIFLIDLAFFIVFTLSSAFASNSYYLILFRFLLGVGIGADYPISASYVSEFMPAAIRGKMLISAFSFQALGMIFASIVGLFVLSLDPQYSSWRFMLMTGAIPALIILILRRGIFESPLWLIAKGKYEEAITVVSRLTSLTIEEIKLILENSQNETIKSKNHYRVLFTPQYIRKTIFSSVPWFFMDVASYAVGIFTPIIINYLVVNKGYGTIAKIFSSIAGAAFVDLFLIIGFILNILLIEKCGRIKLQSYGFLGMACGLFLLLLSTFLGIAQSSYHLLFLFGGFIFFNIFLNFGPNATTFTIPAEIFPTNLRGSGHGFSAGFAKVGAFLGIFFMPIITNDYGLDISLLSLTTFSILGFIITKWLGEETKGKILQ